MLLSAYDIRPSKTAAAATSEHELRRGMPSWDWEDDVQLHGKARAAFLEMQSRSTVPENNFKLLLKYMKLWKKYIRIAKEKKKDAAKEMELRIQAIVHHEQRLTRRAFAQFKQFRED